MTEAGETIRTTCPYCGVGCGVLATPQADGSVAIKGDPEHPANYGRLCSKGAALGETLSLDGRRLTPKVHGAETGWNTALDLVAGRFAAAIAEHGPDSVAFYVSGQLLTEDYYVANKLMKGFIGSANIDSNSRLCMASTVAGHRRAFGSDTVPGCYEDLELADLVVLVGSNLAWCHPVLFQRLMAAREERGTKIVVIDPRRTATAESADLHLAIRADADAALFAGLLARLRQDFACPDTVDDSAGETGPQAADLAALAARTGLSPAEIHQFFELFAATEKVVTVWSQGVNQSSSGADKVNAILNCHLLTGRIGKPGMGPFSVTGQPNAMGGREVGGLANMLAAHMPLEDAAARNRVQRFWASPTIAARPGLKAVDLFQAVSDGAIKALWIMGTNPVVSMPDADAVEAALRACPFVVVSDAVEATDTSAFAHVLLPAATWGEKNGTVTNSERRISRQRAFLPLPGKARPDWEIVAEVARRMGFAGFAYGAAAEVFAEHAALSGFENNGLRDFDISACAGLDAAGYDGLTPFQWPWPAGASARESRFFADGRYYTPDGKARLTPMDGESDAADAPGVFRINTGRLRDQWHTMTRTGKTARLMAQFGEPFCDIHPRDAARIGIGDADLLQIRRGVASVVCRARLTDRQTRGSVFVPMHWTRQFSKSPRINAVVEALCDPVSGQPALKAGQAVLASFAARWHGYAVAAERPDATALQTLDYFALAPVSGGFAIECAGGDDVPDWQVRARALIPTLEGCEWVGITDRSGAVRIAAFRDDRLEFALFVDSRPVEVSRRFLSGLVGTSIPRARRLTVLAGRAPSQEYDEGPIVCACRSVGRNRIEQAIREGCSSVAAVGASCTAGTECGSCRPEIARLIDTTLAPAVRERIAASCSARSAR